MQYWLPGFDEPYHGGKDAGLGDNVSGKGGGRAQVRGAKVNTEIEQEKAALCVTKIVGVYCEKNSSFIVWYVTWCVTSGAIHGI
jgi:hypothetical protein